MTTTPWGQADSPKDRQLRPGPGQSREEVARNQRERLFAATVGVVATRGYPETSVGDLIASAGLSRTSFYVYFADKEACYLATLDELLRMGLEATATTPMPGKDGSKGAERSFEALFHLVAAQPDAARICFVESYTAGEKAAARLDRAERPWRTAVAAMFPPGSGDRGMPRDVSRAMTEALRSLIATRLRAGREAELGGLAPQVIALAAALVPPPGRFGKGWAERGAGSAPRPQEPPPRDLFERVERATMSVIAEKGYAEAQIVEIAAAARFSLSSFYVAFDGKPEALEAGLFRARLRMAAAVMPRCRTARSWAEGIRAAVLATLEFLEEEPTFAKLITVDVLVAGGGPLGQRNRVLESAERLLRDAPGYDALGIDCAAELIGATILSMAARRIASKGTANLCRLAPLATYLAVVPFLGAEAARAVASGQRFVA
jgi:AcrR family transcriptional regulator